MFLQDLSFVVFYQCDKLVINDKEISHCDKHISVFETSKLSSMSRQANSDMH